jgi:uncharacterized membrane protein (DUF2068 family)
VGRGDDPFAAVIACSGVNRLATRAIDGAFKSNFRCMAQRSGACPVCRDAVESWDDRHEIHTGGERADRSQPMADNPVNHETPGVSAARKNRVLVLIGALRLLEGMLVLIVAVGVLKLLHKDVAATVAEWSAAVRIDPHNAYIHAVLEKIGLLDDQRLKEISAGSFIYGGLKLIEGIGLLRAKRWAEYLTVIAIGVMVPVEIHELIRHATVAKVVLLLVNMAVVAYLIVNLRRTRRDPSSAD